MYDSGWLSSVSENDIFRKLGTSNVILIISKKRMKCNLVVTPSFLGLYYFFVSLP